MSNQLHFEDFAKSRCAQGLAKLSIFAFFFILFFCAAKYAVAAPVASSANPTWSESGGNEDMAAAVAAFVASGTPALVGHAEAGNFSSATTAAMNTSGATLLVAWLAVEGADPMAPTDNFHNTWQPLPVHANGANSHGRFFYAYNPMVGPGHTLTATGRYIALEVSAWSGMLNTSGVYQGATGATNTSTESLATSSLSFTGPVLLLTAWASDSQYYQGLAVNQGFTVLGSLTNCMAEEIASHAFLVSGVPGTLVSLAVTPGNGSLTAGATQQFTATGTYSDGSTQNLTSTTTWSSTTTVVATITSGGLATGVAAGATTIQAASGGISKSTSLTVTAGGAGASSTGPTWSETGGNEDMAAAVAAFVASGTPTLVGHAEAGNFSSATTAAMNTSGATLLVAWLAVEGADPMAPTDNFHNTWQPLPVYANGANSHGRFFYAYNPMVGPGHTLTATGRYIALEVSAWSGMLNTSGVYQGATGATNASTESLATSSLSITGPVLLLTAWASDSQYYQGLAVNQGFTVLGSLTNCMAEEIASHAYLAVGRTGTGTAPIASLSPSSLTFINQAVGNATAPQAITLSNTGNAVLSVSSIGITGVSINDFTQTNTCGSSVAAGSSCTISITFSPTAIGARSAGVTLADNAAGSPQTVSLAGTGTSAYASPSPSSLSFASQAIGTPTAAQAVALTNTGNSALTISSITLTGTNSSDFAQTNNCGSSLAAGANCTISVTLTPTASGSRTAAVTFTDGAYNSPQTVSLSGTGAAGALSVSLGSLAFGSQLVGSSGAAQSVTLTNSGNAASSTSSLAVSGTNATSFVQNNNCSSSVAAGGKCTIVVNFSPSTSGNLTASLSVANGATGNPATVSLSGTGSAVAASLSVSSMVFGSLPVGTTSAAQTVILSNTGTAALSISGVAMSGASAGSFNQSNNCGTSLAVGANCAIGVAFSPSSTGSLVATLSVTDNASGSLQTVSLTGTGTTTASGQTVSVVPSDNLQTLVNEYPASTTFSLAPGMYRLQSVAPQSGDSFVGQTGAILSGAALLTNFVQNGSAWAAQVSVTQQASYPGTCLSTSPVCMYPEDLFFNNVLKTRVASLTDVGPGTWYLDYNAHIAYIGDDPSGQTVEISELPFAFSGGASNVTISNLVVEKYAAPAQSAAIQPYGTGWTVENSEVRFNHGRGVSTTSGMNVTTNNIHHNGNLGVGGGGANVTLSDNQISYNNASGYDWAWEAGGAKFAGVTGLTMLSNNSFNNNGPGFWNDISSENVTYTGNQASGNVEAGILIEISDTVTITNNTIVNDGYVAGQSGLYYGAGIVISTSSNVTISGNTITNCMDGISGIYSNRGNNPSGVPYTLSNVVAHGNTITQGTGAAMGIVTEGTEIGTTAVYSSMGNNFSGNTFVLTAPATGMYFNWNNQPMTLATWNSAVN